MKQVRPKKNLGQHFLTDLSIAKRIADTVDACPDIPVLEVGPGMGVMTQYLVTKPRPFKVVEIDRESVAYLKNTLFKEQGVESEEQEKPIIEGDFLRMDLREVFGGQQFVLTGNYPYDISSQIFFKMLDNRDLIPCCTGMIQHEVAVRMASQPGNKQYGILSVLIQAWYDVEYLFTNQRRKMLRVSLRQILQSEAIQMIADSMFSTLRPEQLSIQQFVELTNLVEKALCANTIA